VLLVALALVGCPEKPKATPDASASASASASAAPAPVLVPIPAFATVTRFTLEQKQGGPAQLRCNGVVSEIRIDLATGEWENATCLTSKVGDPMTVDRGHLTDDQKKKIDSGWSKLVPTVPTCGHDGGALTLTATFADGGSASWVDMNWGCRKPAPATATGLGDLSGAIRVALAKKP
jgi:hypothetical protein